jgi:hypothetical protein
MSETEKPIEKKTRKVKKVTNKPLLRIEEEVEELKQEEETKEEPAEEEIVIRPKTRQRKTKKVEKDLEVLGPESNTVIKNTDILSRLPVKQPNINIKVSSYYMNNREIFINFINSMFEPYKKEIENNAENITCENIGKASGDFSLLIHQKVVRDYINIFTPYRGVLLYHGLGSGKTCTSIAIAEGMKDDKRVVIMLPASLRRNYMEELKKCGDSIYKKDQFWEWIPNNNNSEMTVMYVRDVVKLFENNFKVLRIKSII